MESGEILVAWFAHAEPPQERLCQVGRFGPRAVAEGQRRGNRVGTMAGFGVLSSLAVLSGRGVPELFRVVQVGLRRADVELVLSQPSLVVRRIDEVSDPVLRKQVFVRHHVFGRLPRLSRAANQVGPVAPNAAIEIGGQHPQELYLHHVGFWLPLAGSLRRPIVCGIHFLE